MLLLSWLSINVVLVVIRNYIIFFPDPFLPCGRLSSIDVVAVEESLYLSFPEGFVMGWNVMSGK